MALSNDQKAMLRLLAQREQGYDDLAALMGLSVDEVRAKVRDALAQLEEEGVTPPPAPVEPPPAPPVATPEPAPAVPAEPPAAPVAPDPPAPAKPEKAQPATPTPPARTTPSQRPKLTLPASNGARAALAAGAAVVVTLLVVLAFGGGSDSGETTTPSGESTAAAEEPVAAGDNPKLTQAVLSPLDGSDATGVATFGRVKDSLALQVEAEGLAPTAKGESYTVWLYESPQKMLPLASTVVPESGRIGAQVQVPTEVLAYLAKETFDQINISLTEDATLKASLAKATREKKAPLYTGTDVLRGTISGPIIGAASR
jgi:hypothetical protein